MNFSLFLPWLFLSAAILLEVTATSLLNKSEGFTKIAPTFSALILYAGSFFCMARALLKIPVGLVYAVWSGCGIVAVAFVGLVFFKQHLSLTAWSGICLILIGAFLAVLGGGVRG